MGGVVDGRRPASPLVALQGALAGRYFVERLIGHGAMGDVYLCRDNALDRPVAIKVLKPELATRPAVRARFLAEARTAAQLSHPNIVSIFSVEEHDDLVFFIMAYIEGETLGELVQRRGALPVDEATLVIQDVAWALGYAHAHGVVHRDVKPENILVQRATGRALLTDFGIARHSATAGITGAGEVLGTPNYLSPEQASGEPVGASSDVYSLGATAFFALTGRAPFDGPSVREIIAMQISVPVPPITTLRPEAPQAIVRIVERCLSKNPAGRFVSGDALARAIADVRERPTQHAPEVEQFLRRAQAATQRLTLLAPVSGIVVYALETAGRFGARDSMLLLWVGWIVLTELVIQPLRLLAAARRVVEAGIGFAEFTESIQARAYTRFHASGTRPADAMKRRVLIGLLALVMAGIGLGLAAEAGSWWQGGEMDFRSIGVTGVIVAVGFLGAAWLSVWGTAGDDVWRHQTIWTGRFGRWFLRLAAIGLRPSMRQARTAPTVEKALGEAILELLSSVSRSERVRLESVAAFVRKLDERTTARQTRVSDVEKALQQVRQGPLGREAGRATESELEVLLARLNRQRTEALSYLETIRLDLIRIKAGVGSVTELIGRIEQWETDGVAG